MFLCLLASARRVIQIWFENLKDKCFFFRGVAGGVGGMDDAD